MTATTTLRTATWTLDRMLANLRTQMLQTTDGRAILDELPESQRRMLKAATWTL